VVRDDDVRSSLFAALDVIAAKHGPEVPYREGLDSGFAFRGQRVPFLNFQKGIYRAAVQKGPAALSLNTSYRCPYDDEETADGFAYAYRAGALDQPDNRALGAAYELRVPIAYFFVTSTDPVNRRVTLTPGLMVGPPDRELLAVRFERFAAA
jgi:putative restriction endonuclease